MGFKKMKTRLSNGEEAEEERKTKKNHMEGRSERVPGVSGEGE